MTTASPSVAAELRERAAFALAGVFADMSDDALELTPLRSPYGGDAAMLEARFQAADGLVEVYFPRSEASARRLETASALLPHVRGFVSPSVPLFEWRGESAGMGGDFRWGWRAANAVEGLSLQAELITDDNVDRMVRELARFLHELHGFSVERARSLGALPATAWRSQQEALGRRCLRLLRSRLGITEFGRARRWWERYLDDESVWSYEPSLVHGDLSATALLADSLVRELAGARSWHWARVADPALDFAALVDAYGTDLSWRIMAEYGESGSTADASLFRRVRLRTTMRRFAEFVEAVDTEDAGTGGGVEAALSRLRQTAVLRG